jgi:tRNA/tmRNA/rRNA uracil-C5-methylase (TrmA/RlmC/RlmD family)
VFVPGVIPGETITGRIYRNHLRYSDADLLSINLPSPDRVTPKCKIEGCGGCQYQHWDIGGQRKWKMNHVKELMIRIGGMEEGKVEEVVRECIGTEEVYGYRSKVRGR